MTSSADHDRNGIAPKWLQDPRKTVAKSNASFNSSPSFETMELEDISKGLNDYRDDPASTPKHAFFTPTTSGLLSENAPFLEHSSQDHNSHGIESKLRYRSGHDGSSEPAREAVSMMASSAITHRRNLRAVHWMPTTLRIFYVSMLVGISFLLGALTLFLTVYSIKNKGLGDDREAPFEIFGWRFSPTLIATIYSLLIGAMLLDIKRTEVFARLGRARELKVPASSTIFQGSRSWWNDPFDAFNGKKNNGVKSWALFWASIPNIFSFLVLSPLSSGLLYPSDVSISSTQTFNIPAAFDHGPLKTTADDVTLFRTLSSTLLNTTTSPWISNEHVILPFWPSEQTILPSGATFPQYTSQEWSGKTWIFKAELSCTPLVFQGMSNSTLNWDGQYDANLYNLTTLSLQSDDGCLFQLTQAGCGTNDNEGLGYGCGIFPIGGGWWSGPPTYDYPNLSQTGTASLDAVNGAKVNGTAQCGNRTLFFVTGPYQPNTTYQVSGEICDTKFTMANILTTVSISTEVTVDFDTRGFNSNKRTMDTTIFDATSFENAFLSQNWSTKFQAPNTYLNGVSRSADEQRPLFGGPLLLAAAKHQFDLASMTQNSRMLLQDAQQIKQRFLGETMLQNFEQISSRPLHSVQGHRSIVVRRVVVSTGLGITIGVSLILCGLMLSASAFCSRPSRRPLNLEQDPSTAAAIMSMIFGSRTIKEYFRGSDDLSQAELEELLSQTKVSFEGNTLEIGGQRGSLPQKNEDTILDYRNTSRKPIGRLFRKLTGRKESVVDQGWRPVVFRAWTGLALLLALTLLAVAIAVLFWKSRSPGLYQAALTYQLNVMVSNRSFAAFAPYSIVTTLLAIGIKLWWGAMQDPFKRLQPYLAMKREPNSSSHAINLSYVASPLLWIIGKAISHKHWLLAVVCLGAFLSEIFTITMSALWNRQPGLVSQAITVSRSLELRTVPTIFQGYLWGPRVDSGETWETKMLVQVYGLILTSWLYGATIELVYNTTSPPWSQDEWSFSPLDLSSISETTEGRHLSNSPKPMASQTQAFGPSVNVTIPTLATRASLDCKPQDLSNTSVWLNTLNFTEGNWNATPPGTEIGYELAQGYQFNAIPTLALTCCANETDNILGEAAVGYWSRFNSSTTEFTITWLVGKPFQDLYWIVSNNSNESYMDTSHYVWSEIPTAVGLICTTPIIETGNASVTVDANTGLVQNYQILDTPHNSTSAWDDNYVAHNVTLGTPAIWDNWNAVFAHPTHLQDITGFMNYTLSHGYIFEQALLGASFSSLVGTSLVPAGKEPLDDHTFNFRVQGLNLDFMSYAALSLANNDIHALLDVNTLANLSNQIFGVFYKHFVSENTTENSWAYQKFGATVPWDLGTAVIIDRGSEEENVTIPLAISDYQTRNVSSSLSATVDGVMHTRVEVLEMNVVAVAISLAILLFLMVVTIVVFGWERGYFKTLPRDVDTLASVIGFLYARQELER